MVFLILMVVLNGLKDGRVLAECTYFAGVDIFCFDDAKLIVVMFGIFSTFRLKHSLRLSTFCTFSGGLSDLYLECMTDLLFLIVKFLKTGV